MADPAPNPDPDPNQPNPNPNPSPRSQIAQELQAALDKALSAQKCAEDAVLLAKSAAEQAAASAAKAAEDKIAANRALELAAAIPEDRESESKVQRAAKKASVWGVVLGGLVTVILLVIV